MTTGMLTEFGPLRAVAVKDARAAFGDDDTIERQWRDLNFTAAPAIERAAQEHERFVQILRDAGADVHPLPADPDTTLDSIYARDASVVCGRGLILCRMGKAQRATEPAAQARALARLAPSLPVAGRIEPPGRLEGGDLVWFDDRTAAIGLGYRTNAEGIRQFRALAGDEVEVIEVPLPRQCGSGTSMTSTSSPASARNWRMPSALVR